MSEMRADRLLTVSGIGTRSEVKKIIRAGRLSRNGEPVTRPETKLDLEKDRLQLDRILRRYRGDLTAFSPKDCFQIIIVINKR